MPCSAATLAAIERASGTVATRAVERIETDLDWFAGLPAAERSWVAMVAQAGIRALVEWLGDPRDADRLAVDVFGAAPRQLARAVSLHQTVELVRTVLAVVEEQTPALAVDRADVAPLREGVLTFSREIAFAAARVYASAAEARGAWDARLESLVVDGLVRGVDDVTPDAQLAALGWRSHGPVTTVAGSAPGGDPLELFAAVHRDAARHRLDVVAGVHDGRLLVVIGGEADPLTAAAVVLDRFGPGPVVVAPAEPNLAAAGDVTRAALAGLRVATGWPDAPRPVRADDLLPERALDGDDRAVSELVERVYRPLADGGDVVLATVERYLATGGSLEATARALFVHANTVRYRLGRAAEICGLTPTQPRDAFTLRIAITLGRLPRAASL